MITLTASETVRESRPLEFRCPACREEVVGRVVESVDTARLFGLLPLLKLRATSAGCGSCEETVHCAVPLSAAERMDSEALSASLRWGASARAKAMAIVALLTSIVPVLGLLTTGAAAVALNGTRGAWGTINTFALCLAIAVTGCVALMMFMP